jgi:hypothetical protein
LEQGEGEQGGLTVPGVGERRRSRAVSQVEVDGLKDLLGEMDDVSTTDEDEEGEESNG